VNHALSIIFFSRTFLEIDEEWIEKKKKKENRKRMGRNMIQDEVEDEEDDNHSNEEDEDEEDDNTSKDINTSRSRKINKNKEAKGFNTSSSPVQKQFHAGGERLYQDHYMVVG
jgi:hypothetical protein